MDEVERFDDKSATAEVSSLDQSAKNRLGDERSPVENFPRSAPFLKLIIAYMLFLKPLWAAITVIQAIIHIIDSDHSPAAYYFRILAAAIFLSGIITMIGGWFLAFRSTKRSIFVAILGIWAGPLIGITYPIFGLVNAFGLFEIVAIVIAVVFTAYLALSTAVRSKYS